MLFGCRIIWNIWAEIWFCEFRYQNQIKPNGNLFFVCVFDFFAYEHSMRDGLVNFGALRCNSVRDNCQLAVPIHNDRNINCWLSFQFYRTSTIKCHNEKWCWETTVEMKTKLYTHTHTHSAVKQRPMSNNELNHIMQRIFEKGTNYSSKYSGIVQMKHWQWQWLWNEMTRILDVGSAFDTNKILIMPSAEHSFIHRMQCRKLWNSLKSAKQSQYALCEHL